MAGMSVTMSPFTAMIMTSVPPERAGMGSATNDTTRELGGALGVAVLGSIVTTHFRTSTASAIDALPEEAREGARSGLAGALQVAREAPGDVTARLALEARQAFTDGLGIAAIVAAGVVLATAIVASVVLGRTPAPVRARIDDAMDSAAEADAVTS
jgi:hypothetical protein